MEKETSSDISISLGIIDSRKKSPVQNIFESKGEGRRDECDTWTPDGRTIFFLILDGQEHTLFV